MENFENPLYKKEGIELINKIQIELIERFHGDFSNEVAMEWISNHSAGFREILEENDYLEKYKNNPEVILTEIEEKLYKKEETN